MRGFLRLYAEQLGLDGQLFVDEYHSRFASGELPRAARMPSRLGDHARRLESKILIAALAGILAVTLLVIGAWQIGDRKAEVIEPVPVQPPAPVEPPQPVVAAPVPEPPAPPAPAEPPAPPAAPAPVEPVLDLPAIAPERRDVTLEVAAVGRGSMVIVRRETRRGTGLLDRRLSAGESRSYESPVLYVEVARPSGVRIRVDGKLVETVPRSPAGLLVAADGIRVVEPSLDTP